MRQVPVDMVANGRLVCPVSPGPGYEFWCPADYRGSAVIHVLQHLSVRACFLVLRLFRDKGGCDALNIRL